jgi:splicing factor, arginine/serine-rich 4/5/6
MSAPGRRLYIGRLAPDARRGDLEKFFGSRESFPPTLRHPFPARADGGDTDGRIIDCRLMHGFGFVELDNVRVRGGVASFSCTRAACLNLDPAQDAEDIVRDFDGREFFGERSVPSPCPLGLSIGPI